MKRHVQRALLLCVALMSTSLFGGCSNGNADTAENAASNTQVNIAPPSPEAAAAAKAERERAQQQGQKTPQ